MIIHTKSYFLHKPVCSSEYDAGSDSSPKRPFFTKVSHFTPPEITAKLLPLCKKQGIDDVWFQQGSADQSVLSKAAQLGVSYVDSCVFLHHPESGFPHNFHRFMVKIFGKS